MKINSCGQGFPGSIKYLTQPSVPVAMPEDSDRQRSHGEITAHDPCGGRYIVSCTGVLPYISAALHFCHFVRRACTRLMYVVDSAAIVIGVPLAPLATGSKYTFKYKESRW